MNKIPNQKEKNRQTGRKRTMRFLAVFLAVVFAASLLAGCGSGEAEQTSELTTRTATEDTFTGSVIIGISTDTPDVAQLLGALPDTYTVETFDGESALREALSEGRVQMAVLTPGGAAAHYKKDGGIAMVSPVYLGGYRLVGILSHLTIQDPYRPVPGAAATAPVTEEETYDDGTGEETYDDGTGEETVQESVPAVSDTVSVPHDPAAAGEIAKDSILPSQLRGCTVNVWHDTDTLIDLSKALGLMDGLDSALPVIRRYEEETPQDYLTEYNHFALTNILTAYGGQDAFASKDVLLDVDAYWQAMTGQPLPSAVLVVSNALLEQAAQQEHDAAAILDRDFEAAMAAQGDQGSGLMRTVFYGTSNRGTQIMRTYYQQVYSLIGASGWIPDDAFYLNK